MNRAEDKSSQLTVTQRQLEEIEQILLQYPSVRENVVIVREDKPGDKQRVAYLVATLQGDALPDDIEHLHQEQIDSWQFLYEDYYSEVSSPDPSFNIIGWNSTYTGKQLPDEDMREYVGQTVFAILALNPKDILEIGCGSGLLMYRLVPHCHSYVGTDLSHSALDRLEKSKAQLSIPGLQQARFLIQSAEDFTGFAENSIDTVVINSVVQYFPSIDYFVKVITGLLKRVRPGGAIFIGDVRDLALLKAYYASVQVYKAESDITALELKQRIHQQFLLQQELAVAPAFFSALKEVFPQITSVEIRPKRGMLHNEMTCFRYDVVLHIEEARTKPPLLKWHDWQQQRWSIEDIKTYLVAERPPFLALRAVDNARVAAELDLLAWLNEADDNADIAGLATAAGSSFVDTAIDPEALWQLSNELPVDVHIGFTLEGAHTGGCFNVVFTARSSSFTAKEIRTALFPETIKAFSHHWPHYANNPLQEKLADTLKKRLYHFLKEQLSEHKIPTHFVVLEQLPRLSNGTIDLDALPVPDPWQQKLSLGSTREGNYWLDKLTAKPPRLNFRYDLPKTAGYSFKSETATLAFDADLTEKLHEFAREKTTTTANVLLALFMLMLFQLLKQQDFYVGLSVGNQNQPCILPIRAQCSANMEFDELLQQVSCQVEVALQHQNYPFERMLQKLNFYSNGQSEPLLNVAYSFQHHLESELQSCVQDMLKLNLGLFVYDYSDSLQLNMKYDTGVFLPDTIERKLALLQKFTIHLLT